MVVVSHIRSQLKKYFKIKGTVRINPITGKVDVQGSAWLLRYHEHIQLPVQFDSVTGIFDCAMNKLTSLTGAPNHVGDWFTCANNNLESLAGAPADVGGAFYCHTNQLTTLTGAPRNVGKRVDCRHNKLLSLVGAPEHVGGDFSCEHNPLISLEGMPHIPATFSLSYQAGLPLLRTLNARSTLLLKAPDQVHKILSRYAEQGRPGALLAAAELIRAGYPENARW